MRAVVRNAKHIKRPVKKTEPTMRVEIKELDPLRKCGPGTSVQRLYCVVERIGELTTSHLVFLDRHGWYCVHGRACPAVGLAKRKARRRLVR
jgi:hypothetical protein